MLANTRAVRFIGVGFVATATDFIVFNLALLGDSDPSRTHIVSANTLAFAVATVVGYLLNARLTWAVPHRRRFFVRYAIVATIGALIYDAALIGLIQSTDADGYLALNALKVAAVALSATWNFVGFSLFVFRDTEAPLATPAPAKTRP